MPFMIDTIFDEGLDYADTTATQQDLTYTQEATTYTEATSTFTCANKTVGAGATEDGSSDGRKVVVAAVTDGAVTATQTAGWWAMTNGTAVLVATNALTATQALTSGNTYSCDAIDIAIRDAVSV